MVSAIPDENSKSTTTASGRSTRFEVFQNLNNDRSYAPTSMNRYYDQSHLHSEYGNGLYPQQNYNYPSGYNYYPPIEEIYGVYQPTNPKKDNADHVPPKDHKEKDALNATTEANVGIPKDQDMITKGMKVLTGSGNIETEVIERPVSSLSIFQKIFANPIVLMAALIIPLGLLAVLVLPYFNNINVLGDIGNNVLPAVTSTISSGFARSLDGKSSLQVEQFLDTINEYGARGLEDPKCFQRFFCDAAMSHIERRSGGSWSIQKVLQKLSKAVDERVWDSMGIKFLFSSLVNGNCEKLVCTGTSAYKQDLPIMDKLRLLSARLFNYTEVVN
ncbi:hypothetical protein JTE90_015483 [Oedothorax gibbosus]|uniref:Uncharacterized protein n=1 Tax=Oedothorax gibbosus TaxID=931172 RepID=A0AAV6VRF5_9ARAC|nr:hypothetical protein JTE90_015483 [Oedothorax gibbosus]